MGSGGVGSGWAAPRADTPVRGRVELPGSKSHTNRALVLAAVADGPSTVRAPLVARDTTLMAGALRALGVGVDAGTPTRWTITPAALHGGRVDTGLAGTVMRFVPPMATLADGDVHFDGDAYARTRPMSTLLDALRQAGAEVDDGGRGLMPFTVRGRGGGRRRTGGDRLVRVVAVRVRPAAQRGAVGQGPAPASHRRRRRCRRCRTSP